MLLSSLQEQLRWQTIDRSGADEMRGQGWEGLRAVNAEGAEEAEGRPKFQAGPCLDSVRPQG